MKTNKNFSNTLETLNKEEYRVLTSIYRKFNDRQFTLAMNQNRLKSYQKLEELDLIVLVNCNDILDQYNIQLTTRCINLLSSISLNL